jgi:NAD(P)-dependent dehydrogenase (short-subunit alcohol dehydrogenase family)
MQKTMLRLGAFCAALTACAAQPVRAQAQSPVPAQAPAAWQPPAAAQSPAAAEPPAAWQPPAAAQSPAAAEPPAPGPAAGNRPVILVTGSTDGLGGEVARRLAAAGAHVIVHGRNHERGAAVVAEITAEGAGSAVFYAADFASLADVRSLAERVLRHHDRLDVLVNNAGIWLNAPERQLSTDGHELHFAVNYLAGHLLTRLLLPRLLESGSPRIVNVASAAQRAIDFDDVMLQRGYSGSRAYAQSKLAQVMFTFDLAAELAGTGATVVAVHPATLMDTGMVRGAGVRPRTDVAEGADAVLHLVTAAGIESGQYYDGRRPARADAQAYDEAARSRLETLASELTAPPR